MIEHYSFGKIVVSGETYTNDIKIVNGVVKPNWWRKEGHLLCLDDIRDVLSEKPKTIIVGCGHDGILRVMQEVRDHCKRKGIELIELWTADAVRKFNATADAGVAGLFHLTC